MRTEVLVVHNYVSGTEGVMQKFRTTIRAMLRATVVVGAMAVAHGHGANRSTGVGFAVSGGCGRSR